MDHWDLYIGTESELCRLGLVADIGQTQNSTTTYQHLVGNNPDVSALQCFWAQCPKPCSVIPVCNIRMQSAVSMFPDCNQWRLDRRITVG